jgi:hypothetical protein
VTAASHADLERLRLVFDAAAQHAHAAGGVPHQAWLQRALRHAYCNERMRLLLDRGAVADGRAAFCTALRSSGPGLRLLLSRGARLEAEGVSALVRAAKGRDGDQPLHCIALSGSTVRRTMPVGGNATHCRRVCRS